MSLPFMEFYDSDNELIDNGNPIVFEGVQKGTATDPVSVWLYNDRDGSHDSDMAVAPKVSVAQLVDNVSILLNGTAMNGNLSMIEVRSCRAVGVPAEANLQWKPITTLDGLIVGDLPATTGREIQVRINVPPDSSSMEPLRGLALRINY